LITIALVLERVVAQIGLTGMEYVKAKII